MEAKAYIVDVLRHNRQLFSAIYDFNNGIVGYMHSDFFSEALPKKVLQFMAQSPRYGRKILEYLCDRLGINNLGWYNFSEKRYLLCLLSADEIQKIINYIGGICFSDQIRKIILAQELLKIKHVIGNDAYLFSIRNASLMMKGDFAEGFQVGGQTIIERILGAGKMLIEMSLVGIPSEVIQRFVLKFPKNFGWNFNHEVQNPQYYFDFIRKVAKRVLGESNNTVVSMIKA